MGSSINYNELPMNWVGDYAGKKALQLPNVESVFDPHTNTQYTNKQINDRASRVATYLVDTLKLKKGDRIALISRNRLEAVDLFFACAKIGAILCPLSYRLQSAEMKDLLARETPQAIFVEDMFAALAAPEVLPDSNPAVISFGDKSTGYADILATTPRDVNVPLALNDPFLYVHTGGTTATPKICIVSHRQMVWNTFEFLLMTAGGPRGREIVLFPFFHVGGWNVFFCLFMSNGLAILLHQFDPGRILELVHEKKINRLGVVEVMLQFMKSHPKFEETDFSGIDLITTAAAPCSTATLQPYWDRNISTGQAYGLTEGGPSNFAFVAREENMAHVQTNAASIGTPNLCCDYKIVDSSDRDKIMPVGEIGVLCLRSLHNFDGYLNDQKRTDAALDSDGWIYTGDLAVVNEEGFVSIAGRADNVIISGGEKVSPEEVEIALRSHPAVSAAICTGVPDSRWGSVPAAMVVLIPNQSATDADLQAHCRELLAAYKVPKFVAIEQAVPVTPVGKLDRHALKRYFESKLVSQES